MAKTICEHSVNRFLNCSAARPCNMSVPPFTLQGIRNLLSGLILKYFFIHSKMAASNDDFAIFWKRLMSEHSPDPKRWNWSASFTFLWASSGAPVDGVSLQQLGPHFSKVTSSPKNQFQAFWKSYFCKMFPLAELLKLVVAIKVP